MKKIVLAYSGGLDTSIILKWLQINYKAEVIAYTSNIGQDLNKKKIIQNAKRLGVKKIIIEDLKNVFVQMKLNEISPDLIETVVPNIAEYANTQNRILKSDFFSTNEICSSRICIKAFSRFSPDRFLLPKDLLSSS